MASSDPMAQFGAKKLFNIELGSLDFSFTQASLFMVLTVLVVGIVTLGFSRRQSVIPGRLQAVPEILYDIVADMVKDTLGKEGRAYFPFVFTLFVFILFANLLGLIPFPNFGNFQPHSFTVTSQIVVNAALAVFVFLLSTVIGFWRHGFKYLRMFFPEGAPWWTAVILVPIELVSYLSRPLSLSVRLFANMVVGHVLIAVIAGFAVTGAATVIIPMLSVGALVGITALELLVAFLQAYIFTILTCVYLHDAVHMH